MSVLLINNGNRECIVIVALPFNMNMTGSCQILQILIPGGVSSKKNIHHAQVFINSLRAFFYLNGGWTL